MKSTTPMGVRTFCSVKPAGRRTPLVSPTGSSKGAISAGGIRRPREAVRAASASPATYVCRSLIGVPSCSRSPPAVPLDHHEVVPVHDLRERGLDAEHRGDPRAAQPPDAVEVLPRSVP